MYKAHFPERKLSWLWRAGHAEMALIVQQQNKHEGIHQKGACTIPTSVVFRVCLVTALVLLLFNEYAIAVSFSTRLKRV